MQIRTFGMVVAAVVGSCCWLPEASASIVVGASTFFGPSHYYSPADIPAGFYAGGSPTALETFEDETLDFGITADFGSAVLYPDSVYVDSVDSDDGVIDGFGWWPLNQSVRSWFSAGGQTGVTFTFSDPLPTAAGMVWIDGDDPITFEAFGRDPSDPSARISLGQFTYSGIADSDYLGRTDEDRFFGVQNPNGILAIKLSDTSGIEIDHVQYGFAPVAADGGAPEPASMVVWGLGTLGYVAVACRRRATA